MGHRQETRLITSRFMQRHIVVFVYRLSCSGAEGEILQKPIVTYGLFIETFQRILRNEQTSNLNVRMDLLLANETFSKATDLNSETKLAISSSLYFRLIYKP